MQLKLKNYEMLENENRELKNVMRKLCHEMGNALTLLGGSIFYLENELKNKTINTKIGNLKDDYLYICNLFSDLREYNHTEAIEKNSIKLTKIVENIENVFDKLNTGMDTKLNIECRIDTDNVELYADIIKIRQVLINIIKNSLEAMEENSTEKGKNIIVRISKENMQNYIMETENYDCKYLNSENENSKNANSKNVSNKEIINRDIITEKVNRKEIIHIELRDNGKGISEQNIANIFKPMYTCEKKNGIGLGLAVVKKIVEDHCGKIKAVSAIGTGTAMHIYLPALRKIE